MKSYKERAFEKNKEDNELTQELWNAITAKGQKKKVLKNEKLKARLIKAGVDISDAEQ